uniref:DNA-directed RNA polymerase n=1 Tax=Hildenbrandia rubra TaxID=31481 RepID=A0A1C9CFX5_9FLOR|nr:RNA polymerase beta'' subunit [Hildenbrandia rubra]AOM67283.1 RNA polymerase beta'' subunit [Hildenbrandia rubra]
MQNISENSQLRFINKTINKKQLTELVVHAFSKYGIARAANMADQLKDLGFYYATKAGLSLSIEDLRIPTAKKKLIQDTLGSIQNTDKQYFRAEITVVERFQKVIDTWHNMNETLRQEIIKYFCEVDPLNPIYMMSLSGARGNMSQVRQLVGMRGLMSDPNGQIIDLPIISNFREGLTVTEYFISSYGARKGLVDTALRTADSGYLTRRLVDVSQHIIVRESNCQTQKGILLENMMDNQKILISLEQALLGRVLAENIYHPKTGTLIAHTNQCISSYHAIKITSQGITRVLVRSPLTCESKSGVCQFCYGWNLAHRKLVDIGEAIGVIAAQSIGEPGTQLTMRTFHTGGVFAGEVAQKIFSPINGTIQYPPKIKLTRIRTKHGDLAFSIEQNSTILVESNKGNKVKIQLPKKTALFVNNQSSVKQGEVIAESSLSNQFITEEAEKQVITDLSGKVIFAKLTVQETNDNQIVARSTKKEGLIWILSGQVYNVPSSSDITVKLLDRIKEKHSFGTTKITNQYAGYVRILNYPSRHLTQSTEIQIITAELTLHNTRLDSLNKELYGSQIVETNSQEKFSLQIIPGERILNGQILATLISDTYKTVTGGIIKYLDLPVAHRKSKSLKNSYEVLGTGYILWISEETHEINKDPSLLFIQHGDIIEAGTELIKNTFARTFGIVDIVKKDGIVREIIIKPGKLYDSKIKNLSLIDIKRRGFLRPGDSINEEVCTDKLVYWEYIQKEKAESFYILVRPVIVYSVPRKYYTFESECNDGQIQVKVVKTTKFRDGERVKSVNGINLIRSYIVAYIKNTCNNLYTTLEYTKPYRGKLTSQLKLITLETLVIKNNYSNNISQDIQILVRQNQKIVANTTIAKIETFSIVSGTVEEISNSKSSHPRILVFSETDQYKVVVKTHDYILVKTHQWIYAGDHITKNIVSQHSGQITSIQYNVISVRIARPYLLSNAADLHVSNNDLVQQGESIATIKFQRPKTKDIVQGLPKIEEILEARKKSTAVFRPHDILAESFHKYLQYGISLSNATKLSLHKIQLHLVKEIQSVYQSQKVDISDKHIEVIIKQMTSMVEIEIGGNTKYLPGEIVDAEEIEALNNMMFITNKKPALYFPVLLGITKASLNTDSFISAASFQETTKVLTEAAISGKLDWLKGLKENVIIGRLIPAGTGFNIHNHIKEDMKIEKSGNYSKVLESCDAITPEIDDIILDDRQYLAM